MLDLAIVGAGPVGLAAAIEARRKGLSVVNLEKGTLIHTIYRWPIETVFFSEAKNLEIGGHPFPSLSPKPTRREALAYYRRVAEVEGLDIRTYTEVTQISGSEGNFSVAYRDRSGEGALGARFVLLATGYYDNPNRLGVPGEDQPQVRYGVHETLTFWNRDVVVVGGSNSAVESALDLYRGGARVTVVHREAEIRPRVKYWLKPDFDNRVKEGSIKLLLNAEVKEIGSREVFWQEAGGGRREANAPRSTRQWLPADFVIVLIGYKAVDHLLRASGVAFDANDDQPLLSEDYQTSLPGLFVAGSAGFGSDTRTVFIENGREHAKTAVAAIARRLLEQVKG